MHQTGSSGEPDRFTACTGPVHGMNPNNNQEQEPSNKNQEQDPAGGRRRGQRVASEPPIPDALDTPEFRAAWEEWLQYRRERRLTTYTATGAKGQWSRLAKWGVTRAVEAIGYSIAQNYQGIYEEKQSGTNQRGAATRNDNSIEFKPEMARIYDSD
jgi:hypothetical protein